MQRLKCCFLMDWQHVTFIHFSLCQKLCLGERKSTSQLFVISFPLSIQSLSSVVLEIKYRVFSFKKSLPSKLDFTHEIFYVLYYVQVALFSMGSLNSNVRHY